MLFVVFVFYLIFIDILNLKLHLEIMFGEDELEFYRVHKTPSNVVWRIVGFEYTHALTGIVKQLSEHNNSEESSDEDSSDSSEQNSSDEGYFACNFNSNSGTEKDLTHYHKRSKN